MQSHELLGRALQPDWLALWTSGPEMEPEAALVPEARARREDAAQPGTDARDQQEPELARVATAVPDLTQTPWQPAVERPSLAPAHREGHWEGQENAPVPGETAAAPHAEPPASIRSQMVADGVPNDTYFGNQWNMRNTGQSGGTQGMDINVEPVWDDYDGSGVTVCVWDDGVQYTHPDLAANYDASKHIVVGGLTHDPAPQNAESDHGTAVAGLLAAAANGRGTVGVAHGATLVAVDIHLDPSLELFDAVGELDNFDVNNHSWSWETGYNDNLLDPDWSNFYDGWQESAEDGRGGLGSINVKSAGNDRQSGRHVNDCNFANIPMVIPVAAVDEDGEITAYSNPGACVLVSAPSRGAGSGIWTTDRTGSDGFSTGNQNGNPDPDYTIFGGTSSAAPLVSGIAALMLEANPELGWRDVQTILAYSARHVGSAVGTGTDGWERNAWDFNGADTWNGGGLHFSNDYGFGLVDALAAVRLAETWTQQETSANWRTVRSDAFTGSRVIPDNNTGGVSLDLDVTARVGLEHVGLTLEFDGADLGDYRVVVTSPEGTTSVLAPGDSPGDSSVDGWFYSSNAFRGEDAVGTWEVGISDRDSGGQGTLTSARLELYGSETTVNDTFVFTREFSDYAGRFGHAPAIADRNGGTDTINAAAVSSATRLDLSERAGEIDGVSVALDGTFENVFTGDGGDRVAGNGRGNFFDSGRGSDELRGEDGGDRLRGGPGSDELRGNQGSDRLYGNGGSDRLWGGSGNDKLSGGGLDDVLFGGSGRDELHDGSGADELHGDGGRDVFALQIDGDTDRIADYRDGRDLIAFEDLRFGDLDVSNAGGGRVEIAYAGDVVFVEDDGRGRLDASDFTAGDFLFT